LDEGGKDKAMKNFFMITNPLKDPALENTHLAAAYLERAGCRCQIRVREERWDGGPSYTDASKIPADTECILVLGGDGTLIEAARDTVELDIPLLGINLGSLGFLAEVEKNNIPHALQLLIDNAYHIEQRMMLDGRVYRAGKEDGRSHALNDIVITRSGSLQIMHFHIYVNGQFLNGYDADGIILSTPTGSTGYNLSAGGPIVEPRASLLVLTPICPHTLNSRSIVLSAGDEVVVEMAEGKKGAQCLAEVNFDGGHTMGLKPGDRIVVTKSEKTTEIVKLSQASFLEVLHRKMSEK